MFFYLLEILKREKFDSQIKEIIFSMKEIVQKKVTMELKLEYCFNLFVKIFKGYSKRQLILSENKENFEKYSQYFKTNSNYIKMMVLNIGMCFISSLQEILKQLDDKFKLTIDLLNFKSEDYETKEIPSLINYLLQLNRSNYSENIKQLIIFNLNLKLNEKNISLLEKIDKQFFDDYNNESFMDEIIIWKLYKKEPSSDKSNQNYIKTILKGKFTEKEKLKFDLFENIKKSNINNDIKGIDGTFYQSMFDTNKTIYIIKLDLDYFKNHSFNLGPIKSIKIEMELIKKNNNNIDIYAQIENQIINLDNSFDLFMKELKNRNINLEDKKLNTNKIINLEKTSQENNPINNIEIDKLKLQLNEKDKALQKLKEELIEERNRNKKSEKINKELKKNLEEEIKKNQDFKKEIEKDKKAWQKLEKDSKENFIETIIEKDKEIKELKSKLSRLPFSIEEGEKILSIIFISSDQKLHTSMICKNTDEFHKIEGRLYKSFPEYSENDNYFLLNGKKLNRYKTLEENGIKNNDIIILNEIE